jgi:amylosucrase
VWTTFYPYQWDLNWSNPMVFAEMALTLLRLANRGIEAFRLDSTAYLWKRLGTDSMNQPEAHALIQALRAVVDIVAPGVLLKAEAIVPAPALVPYFGNGDAAGHECHLAYHSTLMASLWAALAERSADPLRAAFARTPVLPDGCGWLTYLRCHDDIGWNVLREEAEGSALHARFDLARIARFYAGAEPGSAARGRGFQNAGDDRVHGTNGMTAALCGLDAARERGDAAARAEAEARFLLLHGLMLAAPGLPTLYMGDEIALGNDERYADDPSRAGEGRWLHRPAMDWATAEAVERAALDGGAVVDAATDDSASRIGIALRRMLAARAAEPAFRGDAATRVIDFDDPAVLGLLRGDDVLVLANLSHRDVAIVPHADAALPLSGWRDLLAGDDATHALPATLAPHALRWLRRTDTSAARA